MATLFRTWLNYREIGPDLEKNTLPSETEPDMTLSLRELLDRYAKGLPVTIREGIYTDTEEDDSDFDHLDIADIDDLKQDLAEKESAFQKAIRSKQQSEGYDEERGESSKPQKRGGKESASKRSSKSSKPQSIEEEDED